MLKFTMQKPMMYSKKYKYRCKNISFCNAVYNISCRPNQCCNIVSNIDFHQNWCRKWTFYIAPSNTHVEKIFSTSVILKPMLYNTYNICLGYNRCRKYLFHITLAFYIVYYITDVECCFYYKKYVLFGLLSPPAQLTDP